jgi:hypothetical protein
MTPEERTTLNQYVKSTLTDIVGGVAAEVWPGYAVKGRTGREVAWAHVPWVGVHDPRVDAGARTGVYAALLFAVDGSSVVLSLQVGSTSRSSGELNQDVGRLRSDVDAPPSFTTKPPVLVPPDLRPDYDARLLPYRYERASVIQHTLSLQSPGIQNGEPAPSETLTALLQTYQRWVHAQIDAGDRSRTSH